MAWQSVTDIFPRFTESDEGNVTSMYLDVKGLVTTGDGFLADPIELAEPMPWIDKRTMRPARLVDVVAEWHKVKAATMLIPLGWRAFDRLTSLCLAQPAIDKMLLAKLAANEKFLVARFPKFPDWPADAQLAVHSMAWAAGAGFWHLFPRFSSLMDAQDFGGWQLPDGGGGTYVLRGAAAECNLSTTGNPGVARRNAQDIVCLLNAASVRASGADPSVLHWPAVLQPPPGPV